MAKNYTQDAKQRCLSLIDGDIENIWRKIGQLSGGTDEDKWKETLEKIAREYTFSSRFALMRLFLARMNASDLIDPQDPSRGFVIPLSHGTICRMENITMEHAQNLTKAELLPFVKYLKEQATRQSGADASTDDALIEKALSPVQRRTTLLTREEAFRLGHMLQFKLTEMEWFLLRVFDTQDGFCFNSSNDLIEAYGFLSNSSWQAVSEIKNAYEATYGMDEKGHYRVPKKSSDAKEEDWTHDVSSSLPSMVTYWSTYYQDTKEQKLLAWLGERAPYLDVPSKTALRIYRNLAVYAYHLAKGLETPPNVDNRTVRRDGKKENDFCRSIKKIICMRDYADQTLDALFEDGIISETRCKDVATALLRENKELFSEKKDAAQAWTVPNVKSDGKISVNDGKAASRARVKQILCGQIDRIEKSDMLYLLWFISNLCWFDDLCWLDRRGNLSPEKIRDRLNDFIDVAEMCLNAARLPGFYPPHLMEQSMMLSVVYAYADADYFTPGEVYEDICSSVIARRTRHTNKTKS